MRRSPQVKRAIDKLNQQRNDWIEKLDDWITEELARRGVSAPAAAPQNTETLGSTIDRLSILALRIYHLVEQRDRADATPEHREGVSRKLAIALAQHDDLSRCRPAARRRSVRRPQAAQDLSPAQDVQRPDAESVSVSSRGNRRDAVSALVCPAR